MIIRTRNTKISSEDNLQLQNQFQTSRILCNFRLGTVCYVQRTVVRHALDIRSARKLLDRTVCFCRQPKINHFSVTAAHLTLVSLKQYFADTIDHTQVRAANLALLFLQTRGPG